MTKIKLVAKIGDFDSLVAILKSLPEGARPECAFQIEATHKGVTFVFESAQEAYETAVLLGKPHSEFTEEKR